jgi:hypothetical protein
MWGGIENYMCSAAMCVVDILVVAVVAVAAVVVIVVQMIEMVVRTGSFAVAAFG